MNEQIMKSLGFEKEVQNVKMGLCPMCQKPVHSNSFKDELSRKEFGISGMCQKCQDGFFV